MKRDKWIKEKDKRSRLRHPNLSNWQLVHNIGTVQWREVTDPLPSLHLVVDNHLGML